ncbi:hypothetical protein UFOVP1290_40 [uncultured Caudovirales phage]|uniref:Uncharacterized protein n=1 Tax=uncultured Caudovirales phage TaxID=2100421 RepID=A0A6J5RG38_9CAUD|nr:hypothetical protein UFOVP1290_40 [uncultured Caudovirales phage]
MKSYRPSIVISLSELSDMIGFEVDFKFLQNGCKIIGLPSYSYCTNAIFIDKDKLKCDKYDLIQVTEKDLISEAASKAANTSSNTLVYCPLNKNHPKFAYYSIFIIATESMIKLKTVCKANKLKAFA